MKLLRKKLTVNFSKQCAGFLLQIIFWWLQANVLNNYTIEKGKGKHSAIFKCNFQGKPNYIRTFGGKKCSANM